MDIYKDYITTIRSAITEDQKERKRFAKSQGLEYDLQKSYDLGGFLDEAKENKPLPSLQSFASELGLSPQYNQGLGAHPDFSYLKHSDKIEKHFIVSVFVDIKGSTNLFRRYDPETVFIITNTIQRAAIHTSLIFGGYIHRLQGDGLFIYFGGKGIQQKNAVDDALKASSVFSYFIKNDLKELFNEQGIEDIYTRIGIDLGEKDDVVWAMAGMGEISEITTCSLHTSLASKMQGFAQSNGIVVGDNIKNYTNDSFLTTVSKRTGKESDRYIFQIQSENFNYTQYDFDWYRFLKQLDFVVTDLSGKMHLKRKSNILQNSENIKPIAIRNKPYFIF